jgi:hypothetical protein
MEDLPGGRIGEFVGRRTIHNVKVGATVSLVESVTVGLAMISRISLRVRRLLNWSFMAATMPPLPAHTPDGLPKRIRLNAGLSRVCRDGEGGVRKP